MLVRPMQRIVRFSAVLAATVMLGHTAMAQKHLELKSKEDLQDKYEVFLRKVFSQMYRDDVVLSALCVPSFVPEEGAGIFKTSRGYEVFSITPSASVWSTEYHSIIRSFDEHNREIRWKPADNIKKGVPISYRDIKTRMQTRPVSAELAERIKQLWQAKLLEALNPPPEPDESERYITLDGVRYQYSMPLQGHGRITADGKLVLKNTPVWLMGEFAEALSAYAQGRISEDVLKKELRRVQTKKA
jgi:hypothetical protein